MSRVGSETEGGENLRRAWSEAYSVVNNTARTSRKAHDLFAQLRSEWSQQLPIIRETRPKWTESTASV